MNLFLSRLHADIRMTRRTRTGATHAPDTVPTGVHKEYPRMPSIQLTPPQRIHATLTEAITGRHSYHRDSTAHSFSLEQLSTLFGLALGMNNAEKRHYPSGGALYPVETYLLGHTVKERAPGVYHFHPKAHKLEHLWDLSTDFSTKDFTTTPTAPVGSALIVFTAVWARSSAKYGHLAYLHSAIEAGHMAQNVLLVATSLGLLSRPLAGFDDEKIVDTLDIDPRNEQPLYTVLIGTRA